MKHLGRFGEVAYIDQGFKSFEPDGIKHEYQSNIIKVYTIHNRKLYRLGAKVNGTEGDLRANLVTNTAIAQYLELITIRHRALRSLFSFLTPTF